MRKELRTQSAIAAILGMDEETQQAMKITRTYGWSRRDFSYDEKCENCGHERKNQSGYDDDNYYNNVQVNSKCPSCGNSSVDLGTDQITEPRHDPNSIM